VNLPTDIVIRTGETRDAPGLSEVAAKLFFETYIGDMPAKTLESYVAEEFNHDQQLAELKDADVTTLLVEHSGELVGYSQIRRNPIPVKIALSVEIELWRIYLDKSCHGSGIGKLLLSKALEITRKMPSDHIWLGVWEKNHRALSFYEKHHFKVVGSQEFCIGTEVHNDIVMLGSANAF